jgi:hypothetical protein
VPTVLRVACILLGLFLLFGDFAFGFDLHAGTGCADTPAPADSAPDSDGNDTTPGAHADGCCFGSLTLGTPLARPVSVLPVAFDALTRLHVIPAPRWNFDTPERPPRA